MRHFDAQALNITSYDDESQQETIPYLLEDSERFYPKSDRLGRQPGPPKGPKPLHFDTTEEMAAFGLQVIEGTAAPKSGVWVPLTVGKQVKGHVSLQNINREKAFAKSDVRLLQTLANSMSVALENARLFAETQQPNAELAIINSVQAGLASKLDFQGIIDLVGDKLREVFDTGDIGIRTYDKKPT